MYFYHDLKKKNARNFFTGRLVSSQKLSFINKDIKYKENSHLERYTTVCPIWIWLTLITYYEEANYISALLKAALCMIFPYILIFEKNF